MPARPDDRLVPLILRLRDLKRTLKSTETEIHDEHGGEGVQDQILDIFAETHRTSASIRQADGDGHIRATAITASREVIDTERLKKAVGAELWRKITTLALDHQKLQDAMARGLVDPNVVAQCSSSVTNRPYIKITEIEK